MQRLNDIFLETIDKKVGLQGKVILEVGCGNGKKSVTLANKCSKLMAIDPDKDAIAIANKDYAAPNLTYLVGVAEDLAFDDDTFNLVIFSLSLHHVPIEHMRNAITEAKRVTKADGKVIFLEPAFNGGFFEAEVQFGAGDGDERKEKAAAYLALLDSDILTDETEYFDEITFRLESDTDFVENMEPKRNLDKVHEFLETCDYTLKAQRRINIFSFC
jgi:ubiquinone/menaquinone biosynthesis C-methylase UbiE